MFEIALYEPEIPPNTGNIMRLCANTGCHLHLIHPLGFDLDEKKLRRAGLDYRDMVHVVEHQSFSAFKEKMLNKRILALSTKGKTLYTNAAFKKGDVLLFGPETRGLPGDLLGQLAEKQKLRLPMLADSRSLNLSNSVAVVLYEALRQQNFMGLG
jgi:tRNA (cytidine/uridine-2'-O-)-methyltransferase